MLPDLKTNWYSRIVLLLVVAGLVTSAGCESGSNAAGVQGAKDGDKKPAGASSLPPVKPLLDGWDQPAAVFILSGEQHGYLEPCGCSETQSGGLARRHDLFKQIQKRNWPVAGLDLGGLVQRNREQSKFKFETILNALGELNYSTVALGPEELRFGVDYLLSKREFDPANSAGLMSFVAANITLFDSPDLGPRRWKIVQVGDVKVGVTAVLGAGFRRELIPQGAQSEIAIGDPSEALPPVIEELQAQQPDFTVLLAHARLDESRQLAEKFPQFDLVASAGGPEDPDAEPEKVGDNTMLITVGHKGKHVGVVGYYPQNTESPFRYELVDLDNRRFENSPRMRDFMYEYQQRLKEFSEVVMADLPSSVHPRGSTYVGAAKCGECHTKAFGKWKTTRHAHAYESLIKGREGQEENWVPRNFDPECLACHVTGWDPQAVLRYDTGFQLEALAGDEPHLYHKLKGQQCENCHGPGSRHVQLEELWKTDREQVAYEEVVASRAEIKLTKEIAEKRVCHSCHDPDNSPKFDFAEYWEKVKHPGRD